ncbi:MAG TPA: XdhC family protein, partial [Candidatus Thermoplasmatota archaeon]|nr:XdhC family protein [Candidatus Thermoplasmatota archaeon]
LRGGAGGVHRFDLARWKEGGLDSLCGGTVEVAISLVQPTPHLLLVGAGHCSRALAQVCDLLGWAYTVVDSRAEYATDDAYPNAREVACGATAAYIEGHEDLSRFTHAYLLGHSHEEDAQALLALLARGFPGVIGVIGSRSKMHAYRKRAAERGLDAARVRSPIGLDIGAQTPPEIAIAVAGEVLRDLRAPDGAPTLPTRAETA